MSHTLTQQCHTTNSWQSSICTRHKILKQMLRKATNHVKRLILHSVFYQQQIGLHGSLTQVPQIMCCTYTSRLVQLLTITIKVDESSWFEFQCMYFNLLMYYIQERRWLLNLGGWMSRLFTNKHGLYITSKI